jgi:hypothetical protein
MPRRLAVGVPHRRPFRLKPLNWRPLLPARLNLEQNRDLAIIFQNVDLMALNPISPNTNGFGRGAMSEFGSIFDYQLSAVVFSFGTVAFMATYAAIAMWAVARSNDHVGVLQTA